jgi:predicted DNA-binding transcriptional regulator AlpA
MSEERRLDAGYRISGDELLKSVEVARMLRISAKTLARWRQQGKGPEPLRLGYNLVVYRRSSVEAWISKRNVL